jgi:hypothetical protein
MEMDGRCSVKYEGGASFSLRRFERVEVELAKNLGWVA